MTQVQPTTLPIVGQWYKTNLTFTKGHSRKLLLDLQGYTLGPKRIDNRVTWWQCSKRYCQARAATYDDKYIRFGELYHNHPIKTAPKTWMTLVPADLSFLNSKNKKPYCTNKNFKTRAAFNNERNIKFKELCDVVDSSLSF